MAAVNGTAGYGLGNQAPYVHVFGLPFDPPLLASLEHIRLATTVPQLAGVLQSPNFREKMISLGEIDDVAVRDDVGIFSNRSRVMVATEPAARRP
jgi:hypothetical protein